MERSLVHRIATLLVVCLTLPVAYTSAQNPAPTIDAIQRHFEDILAHPTQAQLQRAPLENLLKPLETASTEEVSRLMPVISRASAHQDIYVQFEAAAALVDIVSNRKDRVQILTPYLEPMRMWLNHPDDRLANMGLLVLSTLNPPPPSVLPMFLEFSKRTDADTTLQASALWAALKQSPNDPVVIQAVQNFASRKLDATARMRLMDGLGLLRVKDPGLLSIIEDAMHDSEAAVRTRSLYEWMELGPEELRNIR